jgi:signal transduction histidine kinase
VINTHKKTFPSTISITPIYEETSIIGANIFIRNSKKEQERERKKDDFLNILAHELRTPITGIKLYNQLLLEQLTDSSDQKRTFALKMASEIDRLHKLIQDSFDLAQIQSGKLRLDREFFGIDDFIKEKVQTLQITHPHREITVASWSNSVVFAEKNKIEQVFINLINNAGRFSPQSKPIIVHLISENDYVTIGIQDFGKGITQKFQKRIFARFYQIENTLTEKNGLGLGLYISSCIVKAHEGKMWVTSKIGKGSTFYFSLPKT